jgi:hypothetical protein
MQQAFDMYKSLPLVKRVKAGYREIKGTNEGRVWFVGVAFRLPAKVGQGLFSPRE